MVKRVNLDRGYQPLYGIFGLEGGYWCENGVNTGPNYCKTSCDLFMDKDLKDDLDCVSKMLARKGLDDWLGRKYQCCREERWKEYLVPDCPGEEEEERDIFGPQVMPEHICDVSRLDIKLHSAYQSMDYAQEFLSFESTYKKAYDYVSQDLCQSDKELCGKEGAMVRCSADAADDDDATTTTMMTPDAAVPEKCLNEIVMRHYAFESKQLT